MGAAKAKGLTNRQKDVLNAVSDLLAQKTPVTIGAVAGKMGTTQGPVFNHLQDLKASGHLSVKVKDGRAIPGSWALTSKGRKSISTAVEKVESAVPA